MKRLFSVSLVLVLFSIITFAQDVVIEGDITTNTTLTANNTYLLRGFVRVQSGATLTIEAGTYIFGENTTQGSLIIKPGGKIMAMGTENNPIVFTSEYAKAGSSRLPTYGDWGGIILLGNARINVPGGTAAIEGPGDSYGGTNDDDNSGVMQYVRIEYPGIAFTLNNEINGLTFGGVGRGTTIEHIQVSYSGDDSYEWFGGTVNCKYLIAYRGWDDDFDTDFGYNGKLQYLVGLRDPEIADQSQSNGFESDNDGSGSLNEPRTSPTWWNVTLVGPKATSSTTINSLYRRGMHLRRSSLNKVSNTLILGWPTGIRLDGVNTIAAAINNTMWVNNSIISGWTSSALDTASAGGANFNVDTWWTNSNGRKFTANTEVALMDPFNLLNPNFLPASNSPALSGASTPPNDGFFDQTATYVGAFGEVDWTANWSNFNPLGYVTDVPDNQVSPVPTEFKLSQNYPNPFNPSTKIVYSVTEPSQVKLIVTNILGQVVETLINDFRSNGTYEVNFDASKLTSGLYIYTLEAGSTKISKKMTLLK
ncbi:MAG TPA: hypothetical protein DHV28_16930 [Ignavibacteriales bacterium]|nr:hypothetical protein [Ignavibacteriales bacterium]